jgi:putative FmdB family regulatory protein
MPAYDYHCKACDHRFTVLQTLAEHEKAQLQCPQCQSRDVELVYGHVFVKTSRKS